ncbi:carboxypeptidase M32 [Candidatus Nitronereus thalassa]|uniref:Metal-dependent carboxypeptidase n=1 Tax=Candidatus Nitronereus thalassa TaxID=3020898 RepID=A0ABU3KC78_9BACT|nr:carboxypeptidase M32 [Candidatus Nitronereus thalassa]MDT7043877.1 carboxypeptidase M32 [Candidatus Nitronereus thalassa]
MTTSAWDTLSHQISELDTLAGIGGLLAWDQQVIMPSNSVEGRTQQSEMIGRLYHEQATSPRLGELIEAVAALPNPTIEQQAAVRNLRRTYARSTCVPQTLASQIAKASANGIAAWGEAKKEKNYKRFVKSLQTNLDLALERAQAIDSSRHPYDVLLEDYDPGTTVKDLRLMFGTLQPGLTTVRNAALAKKPAEPFTELFEVAKQLTLHQEVIRAVGYDTTRGALHEAEHPFSCRVGRGDVRIATHVHERDFLSGLAATMHELGHALYEQGIPDGPGSSAVYAATSTGLHESQSRLWENMVGRSLEFYQWLQPLMTKHFPRQAFDPENVFKTSCHVNSGSIRIFSDEVSYNLHIILRFEMELALLEKRITVNEAPGEWEKLSEQYLGIRPSDPAEGILQDAHWAGGAFGYFPSYTLGNLYAASLFAKLHECIPNLGHQITEGNFAPTLQFLRERIHHHGHLYETPDLLQKAVGTRDHVKDLLAYLQGRYAND